MDTSRGRFKALRCVVFGVDDRGVSTREVTDRGVTDRGVTVRGVTGRRINDFGVVDLDRSALAGDEEILSILAFKIEGGTPATFTLECFVATAELFFLKPFTDRYFRAVAGATFSLFIMNGLLLSKV